MQILKNNEERTATNLRAKLEKAAKAGVNSKETIAEAILRENKKGISGDISDLVTWAKGHPRTETQWVLRGGGEVAIEKDKFTGFNV